MPASTTITFTVSDDVVSIQHTLGSNVSGIIGDTVTSPLTAIGLDGSPISATWSVTVSDPAVLSASIAVGVLEVQMLAKGTGTVTITAVAA